jgi:hypothetical protein
MKEGSKKKQNKFWIFPTRKHFWFLLIFMAFITSGFFLAPDFSALRISYKQGSVITQTSKTLAEPISKAFTPALTPLDIAAYNKKLIELANNPPPPQPTTKTVKNIKTGVVTTVVVPAKPTPTYLWPVKASYPLAGALLPFNRIVAYYGNLYSKGMGVLGEYPEEEMLSMLQTEVQKWQTADPTTPVIPALHYIAVVAQGSPGSDGKYRARMPDSEIDKVITMAAKINAVVFLDVQVGFSNVQTEVPLLEKYLKMPNVHLGIDPEFSMKTGIRPGKVVGTLDATDIDFAANYLAKLVDEYNLPPKVLIVHRYTEQMVTNYKNITPLPEVQIVMNMDGWGTPPKKIGTYNNFIYPEPVQFTGFKLFYKNDLLTPGTVIMTPEQILQLRPQPIYIQYQ